MQHCPFQRIRVENTKKNKKNEKNSEARNAVYIHLDRMTVRRKLLCSRLKCLDETDLGSRVESFLLLTIAGGVVR